MTVAPENPPLPDAPEQENLSRIGWRVVFVSSLAMLIIFGIRLSFSVFFAEFTADEGWSSKAAASIFSINMAAFALGSVPAGMVLDRYGPRRVFAGGAFLLGMSLFLSGQATGIRHVQLAYGVFGGLALAVIGLAPVSAIVAGWFPHRRGLAIGIAFAGTGLGSLIFVPVANWLIETLGWRAAYRVLGLVCILVLMPLMAFGQRRPPRAKRQSAAITPSTNKRAQLASLAKMPIFWWLLLLAFVTMAPVRTLTVHQVAYMVEVGIHRQTAANYVGLAGFLTAGSFVAWGFVSDRLSRVWAFGLGAVCLLGAVSLLFALKSSHGVVLLAGYAIFLALGEGSRSAQTAALTGDIFHGDSLGMISGMVGAMFGLGAAATPWLIGYLRDAHGNYDRGLQVVVGVTILSVVAFGVVNRGRRQYSLVE